uniref:Uncharacterized protein n=1 Tax=Prymnesium polylepis TaxID=72548 RepID=A0A6V4GC92_9EUKA|mmetsp:Transcript_10598/g.28234  ORF Transcript_10598/g.28234 Transcript_10598/m.28234 type:complete len:214 (+) Transcript_10598:42-683(+)
MVNINGTGNSEALDQHPGYQRGGYVFPLDAEGKPIAVPDWRDVHDIKVLANPMDTDLITAVRFDDKMPGKVEECIANGADINQKDRQGFTPLMLALKARNQRLIHKFLDIDGVDVNAKTLRGFTPLHLAAWKGDSEAAQKLINKGADKNAKDSGGRNAWGIAHENYKEEILELFKRNGLQHKEHDKIAWPPAPKYRESQRDTWVPKQIGDIPP